jgi:16S rRNA (guanine527-N7)-methyltransferase
MSYDRFGELLGEIGIPSDEALLQAFSNFEEDLYAANQVMNLTRVPREECWLRHFLDSLLFHDLLPPSSKVLDIGTGPGFPSWPLALARPDLKVTALDSSGKMLGFLRRHQLPNLEIVQERGEDWGVRDQFDIVTGRAVAPLPLQLELSAAPCLIGGAVIPMRTAQDAEEIYRFAQNGLGLLLEDVHERRLPELDAPRVFPVFRKASPTPRQYPRPWSEMKRKPL